MIASFGLGRSPTCCKTQPSNFSLQSAEDIAMQHQQCPLGTLPTSRIGSPWWSASRPSTTGSSLRLSQHEIFILDSQSGSLLSVAMCEVERTHASRLLRLKLPCGSYHTAKSADHEKYLGSTTDIGVGQQFCPVQLCAL